MNIQAGASSLAAIDFGDSADSNIGGINYNNANDTLNLRSGNLNRLTAASNGDISFYDSAGSSQNFYWDSSTSRLGLGTTAPNGKLEINGGTGVVTAGGTLIVRQDGNTYNDGIAITSSNASSHRIWKDSSGRLNIGGSSTPTAFIQDLSGNASFSGAVTSTGQINAGTNLAAGTSVYSGNGVYYGSTTLALKNNTSGNFLSFAANANATFSGSVSTGNMTLSGQEIDVSSGILTLDVAGDIRLDAGGGNIQLLKGGTEFGRFFEAGTNDFYVYNPNSDKDIIIYGNDAGTSFEAARFDMSAAGAATFNSTVTTNKLTLTKDPVGTYSIEVDGTNTGQPNLIVKQSTSERLRIDNLGRVGIATSSPQALLHIQATSGLTPQVKLGQTSAYQLQLGYNNSSEYGFLQAYAVNLSTPDDIVLNPSGGNVGIGTSSPVTRLHSVGSEGEVARIGSGSVAFSLGVGHTGNGTGYLNLFPTSSPSTSPTSLAFQMGGSERMRIDSSGRVGIGTSSPTMPLSVKAASNAYAINMHGRSDGYSEIYGSSSDGSTRYAFLQTHSAQTKLYTLVNAPLLFGTNSTERMRLSGGNLLVGTSTVSLYNSSSEVGSRVGDGVLMVNRSGLTPAYFNRLSNDGTIADFRKDGTTVGSIGTNSTANFYIRSSQSGHVGLEFGSPNIMPMKDGALADNAVDLGISTQRFKDLYLSGKIWTNTATGLSITANSSNRGILNLSTSQAYQLIGGGYYGYTGYKTGGYHRWFGSDGSEDMRLSGGNLLVGKTSVSLGAVGVEVKPFGEVRATASGAQALQLNRLSSDGIIADFRKDSTSVGSIGTLSYNSYIGTGDTGILFAASVNSVLPHNTTTNAARDAEVDLGYSSGGTQRRFKDLYLSGTANVQYAGATDTGIYFNGSFNAVVPYRPDTGVAVDDYLDLGVYSHRWDDIFATNGTIQTSDRNEKQDIESLTEAEERVAVAAKGLLKKFRWKNAVEDKGDDARIHFGIIAQDLQDAFEAEGLDAGRYGMFTSNTWTNEDGEEQTRMGVRYSELLAFIISAI